MKNWFERLATEIETTRESGIYGRVFVLSIFVRLFKYISLYFLFAGIIVGLGLKIDNFPLFKVFFGMISAEFAASLPISGIAGFGAYEGTWIFIFTMLGYSEKLSAIISVTHHLITQVYGYGLGAIAALVILIIKDSPLQKTSFVDVCRSAHVVFWSRLLVFIVTLLALTLWYYQENGFAKSPFLEKIQRNSNSIEYKNIALSSSSNLPGIKGRLIYQRPDGIYLIDFVDNKSKMIIKGGTYPRFSNDGGRIIFLHGKRVMIARYDGKKVRQIAVSKEPRAVLFYPDGKHILYTDGKKIMIANIKTKSVEIFLEGYRFREIDLANDGKRLAATVKNFKGYSVIIIDMSDNKIKQVARGCSATLSPDGKLVTVNERDHKSLKIFSADSLELITRIHAPSENMFDNQKWSNVKDWIVSTSEKGGNNIYIHRFSTDTAYKMTESGDCDRADLFVSQ